MESLPAVVYALSALATAVSFVLLLRGWMRTRVRLIMWAAWCFAGLTINGLMVLLDHFTPNRDLSEIRALPALLGVMIFAYGLIRENT